MTSEYSVRIIMKTLWLPLLVLSVPAVDMESIREILKEFNGVEHRIEYCGTFDGVDYYNDSKEQIPTRQ